MSISADQFFRDVARNLDRFLNRPALRHQPLHLLAGREVNAFGQLLDVELDQAPHVSPLDKTIGELDGFAEQAFKVVAVHAAAGSRSKKPKGVLCINATPLGASARSTRWRSSSTGLERMRRHSST